MNESLNCYESKYILPPCVAECVCTPLLEVMSACLRYLESEWEVRRGSSRDFGADEMQSSHCKVPLQDNSSDCGLYLLHYVESFLKVNYFMCL